MNTEAERRVRCKKRDGNNGKWDISPRIKIFELERTWNIWSAEGKWIINSETKRQEGLEIRYVAACLKPVCLLFKCLWISSNLWLHQPSRFLFSECPNFRTKIRAVCFSFSAMEVFYYSWECIYMITKVGNKVNVIITLVHIVPSEFMQKMSVFTCFSFVNWFISKYWRQRNHS